MQHHKIFNPLINWRNFRLKLFVQGIVVGIFAGTIVVIFRYILEKADIWLKLFYTYVRSGNPEFLAIWAVVLLLIAFLLGSLVRRYPLISGSGIPQVKGAVSGDLEMNWVTTLLGKFMGGILAIGAGLSLGREGPSIQLGAVAGQGVSRLFGSLKVEERILITSGASAGLAAAFNAPLAGAIFALEELHKNFSPPVLMSAMAASLTADFISKHFFGIQPIFNFHALPILPFKYYGHLIIMGLFIGLLGVLFNWCLLKIQDIYKSQNIIPPRLYAAVPLLISIAVGLYFPACLGGGNRLIDSISQGHFGLYILVILVCVKFLFTIVSYGSGVPGGIFLPMLVIGALSGGIFGNIAVNFTGVDPGYVNNFVVFAMAGYFTAVVKAPITGSILITEMTGSFGHLFPIIMVSMAAYIASDILHGKPIYDELLHRLLLKRDDSYHSSGVKKKILLEAVVCVGSALDQQQVRDIKWPANCLLVGIRRGEAQLIPHGDTNIMAGDYLSVLANEAQAGQTNRALSVLVEAPNKMTLN
ncbi:MAG: ClC family H(+)/Cl(-) exchange transporter [Syntrophomonadaceae bacterium]|nr:ClC family H(+)/Cl(-) exchange transporter [Syntrophomonadaceae bacterium]